MHFVLIAGIAVILGGAMQGSFALPMRFVRSWQWENIWLVYSLVGLLLMPWAVAQATISDLPAIYHSVSTTALAGTLLFGLGWGVANVMFGLAVPRAGMALTFAIVLGMSASLGALIPLMVSNRERLLKPSGLFVIAGVALTLLGVFLLGYAARAREKTEAKQEKNMVAGLVLAVLAGVLAPMLNFSFAFGADIVKQAIVRGATPVKAVNAIWAVALAGGFLSNGGYSVVLLTRNHSWSRFQGNVSSDWGLAAIMGVLWTSGILLYGWGASLLGNLGPSVGWPVFQAMIVVTSSVIGFGMGEWKNAEARTVRIAGTGLAVLVGAIILLSIGNRI